MVTMHHYSTQEGHFQHYWFTKVQTNQEIEFPSRHPGFNIQTKLFPVRKISFCYIIYFVTCGWRFYGDKMWLAKVKQHSFPTRTVMIFVKSFTPADRSCLCFATEIVMVYCWRPGSKLQAKHRKLLKEKKEAAFPFQTTSMFSPIALCVYPH